MTTPLRATCLSLLALATSLALPLILRAGTDWVPVDPAELQMKDLPEQPGAPAFVLFHEEIDNDQQGSHSMYMRIKVLSEAGRKYADVQIPYYKEEFNISDIHGRTIHPDGSIVEFQGKPFDKVVVKSKNLKVRVKAFTLPDVQVGSILEYRFTLRTENRSVWPPRWAVQSDLFQRKEHFKFVPYSGTIQMSHGQVGQGLAYNSLLPRGSAVKTVRDTYELDLANVPAFVEEEHMPPPREYKYYVHFYYRGVNDADQYWREEGKYWNSDTEKFLGKKHAIPETVAGIVAASDSPEQKVKKIYAYVAELDNLTYKPQRTQQEQKVLGVKDNRGVEDVLRLEVGRPPGNHFAVYCHGEGGRHSGVRHVRKRPQRGCISEDPPQRRSTGRLLWLSCNSTEKMCSSIPAPSFVLTAPWSGSTREPKASSNCRVEARSSLRLLCLTT